MTHLRAVACFSTNVILKLIQRWVTLCQVEKDRDKVHGVLCSHILQVEDHHVVQLGVGGLQSGYHQGSAEGGGVSLGLRVLGVVPYGREEHLNDTFHNLQK